MEVSDTFFPKKVEIVINILQRKLICILCILIYFVSHSDPLAFIKSSKQMEIAHKQEWFIAKMFYGTQ